MVLVPGPACDTSLRVLGHLLRRPVVVPAALCAAAGLHVDRSPPIAGHHPALQAALVARPPDRPAQIPHDAAYKAMYRHPQTILDLRHFLAAPSGPLHPGTLAALDFSTLAKLPAEWVTADFRRRHGDQVWRIRFRDAASDAGAGAWLLLLLEFQSRDDTDMALRILGYVVELYRDLEAQGVVRPGTRRPPVLPVVIHNGVSPWRAPVEVTELIALRELPAPVRRDLESLQPSQRLHVVDFPTCRQEDLVPGNVVSLQIGFEYAGPSDYETLLPAVVELRDAGLRRTVWEWVVRRAHRHGLALEGLDVEGTFFRSRIGENMKRATEAWFAEGRAEGVEEGLRRGIEQGLEQQRALLMRQVATKFGVGASERIEPLLARVVDAALLVEIGDVLLVSGTETELVERVEAVVASGVPSSGR